MFHKEFITLKRRSQIGYGEGKFSGDIINKAGSLSILQNAKFSCFNSRVRDTSNKYQFLPKKRMDCGSSVTKKGRLSTCRVRSMLALYCMQFAEFTTQNATNTNINKSSRSAQGFKNTKVHVKRENAANFVRLTLRKIHWISEKSNERRIF